MDSAALKSIMLSIAQARSVAPILEQIVQGVSTDTSTALARLWLLENSSECPVCSRQGLNSDTKDLHLAASTGWSIVEQREYNSITGSSHLIRLGERKIGRIAQSGEPLLIGVVSPEQEWVADPDWIRRESVQSFAGQPLICRGEVLGVLAVFSRVRLSSEEFDLLRTFADHAAVAIWNARAFDELNRLRSRLELENEYLAGEVKEALHFGEIIGSSAGLRKVLEQVELVANTEATVLIQGESGTGKELVARAVHERSRRGRQALIKVNCSAIPHELFESEFFGHVKGAFTGAIKDRVGRFELADGGDIFLDEVGEIPVPLQAKLLRVLQEKEFERVGDTQTRKLNVRIIAATNRNLKEEVTAGRFREDLFYRLSVFPIEVPPLRERREDIGPLALHFIQRSANRLKIPAPRLTNANVEHLKQYNWPGNVRELENVVERAMILSVGKDSLTFDLPHARENRAPSEAKDREAALPQELLTRAELRRQEKKSILAALNRSNGKVFGPGGAAELLGMKPTTLASRMRAFGLRKKFVHDLSDETLEER